jgi:predicted enzyme related to lactoylglutathione lyase
MGQPVVHFEIRCRDKEKTKAFFTALFDWTTWDMGPASMINTGSSMGISGHITSLGHEPHYSTIFYVSVDDLQAYLTKAESLGGKMLVSPVAWPDGSVAWLADPEGNTVGLWQPKV